MKPIREPSRTVTTATVSGSVTILVIYLATLIWPGLAVPPEVASAFTLLTASLGAWIVPDPDRRPNAKH